MRKNNLWFRIFHCPASLLIAAVACALPCAAQQSGMPPELVLRSDSNLVLVPVTVVDRRGAFVSGLSSADFSVLEDGVPQQIRSVSEQDVPVSLGIVLDVSTSMRSGLGAAKDALRVLLGGANPADDAFLTTVSTRPSPVPESTHNFGALLARAALENAHGDTALIDAIDASLRHLRLGANVRKALIVISDGMDNHSRRSQAELLKRALESGAQIYCVAIDSAPLTAKPATLTEEKAGLLRLEDLATRTGGLSIRTRGAADAMNAAAQIGRALRNQYVLGYAPSLAGRDGKWHRIKVRVGDASMRAYARTGYRFEDAD